MKEDKLEKLMNDFLYDNHAREVIGLSQNKSSRSSLFLTLGAVAACIGILIFFIFPINNNLHKRKSFITSNYSFPEVVATRSPNTSIVYLNKSKIENQKYSEVLALLQNQNLDETDAFYKSHLYFALDSLDESKRIIIEFPWTDSHIKSEIYWLNFLIELKSPNPNKHSLDTLYHVLSNKRKKLAAQIME